MKAIIVEDSDVNYLLVREILTPLGWSSEQVATASQLESAVARVQPDLIVMDISLPDGDGLELTRDMRGRGVKTPIVVMSAHDHAGMAKKALDAGADAFFHKPFELARLEEIFRDLTQKLASTAH